MRTKHLKALVFILAVILTSMSCSKNDEKVNISAAGLKNSHKMGKNCMECHKSGGWGKGAFVVAGTVYNNGLSNTYADAVVKLYTQASGGGTLAGTIYGDANGNFYTTESIDLSGGVYPSVSGTGGSVNYMQSSITVGACNSCHGNSVAKLWAK
ncbi:MAG TPA: hypothetical protein VF870_02550 [Ignavibacteriaceae bacterium]